MSQDGEAYKQETDEGKVPWWCSSRLGLSVVGFLGFINLYALRVNMSVAMVCMINHTAVNAPEPEVNQTYADICPGDLDGAPVEDGEFAWSKELQGFILGSFFWGYLLTQIPGGWLAERYGGKRVFGFFMLACAVATLLTPVGARVSPYVLIVLRIIAGIGQGVVWPAMTSMWAKWAPPLERSTLIGFTYAGAQLGNVITLPLSGILCDSTFLGGWPAIFYILGTFGVLWFVLWMLVVYDTPAVHPRITGRERRYIEEAIGAAAKPNVKAGTPWRGIFRSPAVWAIVVAHTCANWGTYTLLTNIPTYMREVLRFDMKQNGFYSAVPYIAFWVMINVAGWIADFLIRRGWRVRHVRKMNYSLGTILPGAFLIGTGYVSCHQALLAVGLLTIAVGCSGFQYPGCMVNHVDIAPPFAGMLFGISNTMATLPGILAPYAVAVITEDQSQQSWTHVFYLSAVIYAIGCVVFAIFAQGDVRDWVGPYLHSPGGASEAGTEGSGDKYDEIPESSDVKYGAMDISELDSNVTAEDGKNKTEGNINTAFENDVTSL